MVLHLPVILHLRFDIEKRAELIFIPNAKHAHFIGIGMQIVACNFHEINDNIWCMFVFEPQSCIEKIGKILCKPKRISMGGIVG